MPPPTAIRVSIDLPAGAAEPVAAFLRECCAGALELQDDETLAHGGRPQGLPAGHVRLIAYPPDALLNALIRGLRDLIGRLRRTGLLVGPTSIELDEDRGEWTRPSQVVRVARRFCITRPWVAFQPAPNEIHLPLDPAGAFGDGRHPSTALVLTLLDRLDREGHAPQRVLDLGCGSGVLALAAAQLWPRATIHAIDIDRHAVEQCRRNAARMGLENRLRAVEGQGEEVGDPYPLVLANLTAGILQRFGWVLAAHAEVGGLVVAAGFVETALDRVERTLLGHHLFAIDHADMAGWHALVLRRRADP